ncbi:hypothetical protein GCM10009840_32690 [Pseudolysinimonas kribbensis]|uniref:DUF3618 domain-containing protein n=1 Tax=Pseudolysinimonas kribbensis TaxID=433641 RepID=A0ABQ6JZD2_9MICO|nr:hypothetical protein [Pseudolysinimonas kribbensis]GMA93374.1 hypothetical protein GCM10025881_01980 [Pseudolysinimonas kribbensis]
MTTDPASADRVARDVHHATDDVRAAISALRQLLRRERPDLATALSVGIGIFGYVDLVDDMVEPPSTVPARR